MENNEDDKDKDKNSTSWTTSIANFLVIAESSIRIISYLYRMYDIWNDNKQCVNYEENYNFQQNNNNNNQDEDIKFPIDNLPEDEETDDQSVQCKICITNKIRTINNPCGHAVFCIECMNECINVSGNNLVCPICRAPINKINLIFL